MKRNVDLTEDGKFSKSENIITDPFFQLLFEELQEDNSKPWLLAYGVCEQCNRLYKRTSNWKNT